MNKCTNKNQYNCLMAQIAAILLCIVVALSMMPITASSAFAKSNCKKYSKEADKKDNSIQFFIDFGEKHTPLANEFAEYLQNEQETPSQVNGSKVTITVSGTNVTIAGVLNDFNYFVSEFSYEDADNRFLHENELLSQFYYQPNDLDYPSYTCVGLKPIEAYTNEQEVAIDMSNENTIEDGMTIYVLWKKELPTASLDIDIPKCGQVVKTEKTGNPMVPQLSQTPASTVIKAENVSIAPLFDNLNTGSILLMKEALTAPGDNFDKLLNEKIEGGKIYYAGAIAKADFYHFVGKGTDLKINGVKATTIIPYLDNYSFIVGEVTADHDWNDTSYEWKSDLSEVTAERTCKIDSTHKEIETVKTTSEVTKPATTKEEGTRTYTAKFTNSAFKEQTKTESIPKLPEPTIDPEKQMGKDGTALGEGASAAAADKAIRGMKNDKDPAGATIAPLFFQSSKQTKKSITLKWNKTKGAAKYVIYGNACGKKNKMKKLTTTKKSSSKVTKAVKKIRKGTYYKFILVALDKNNNVVSASKVIHVATKGSNKKSNPKGLTIKAKVNKNGKKLRKWTKVKAIRINVSKSTTIKVSIKKVKKAKIKSHVGMRFESADPKVATVNAKGKIKGIKKGKTKVFAYAQNGISKTINVTVK